MDNAASRVRKSSNSSIHFRGAQMRPYHGLVDHLSGMMAYTRCRSDVMAIFRTVWPPWNGSPPKLYCIGANSGGILVLGEVVLRAAVHPSQTLFRVLFPHYHDVCPRAVLITTRTCPNLPRLHFTEDRCALSSKNCTKKHFLTSGMTTIPGLLFKPQHLRLSVPAARIVKGADDKFPPLAYQTSHHITRAAMPKTPRKRRAAVLKRAPRRQRLSNLDILSGNIWLQNHSDQYATSPMANKMWQLRPSPPAPPSSSSESSSLSQRPPSTPSPIDRQTLSEPISWSKWEGFLVWRQDLGRQVQPPYTSGGRWSEFPDVGVPTSKGLNNRANDCYRSAVLQALFHVPAFYRYMATIHRIYATSFAIMHAPEVLFLQFGRFDNFARKISTEISYPEILDLNMHREPGVVNEECIYRLDAVVAHKGSNIGGGHYVAAVRKHHEEGFEVIDDAYEIASSRGGGFQEMLRPTSQGWGGQAFILMYSKL